MEEVAQKAIREQMSVRAVEKLVKGMVQPKPKKKEKARDIHMEAGRAPASGTVSDHGEGGERPDRHPLRRR